MNYTLTIFDIEGNPMPNQPLDLLQNGQMIAQATTDVEGTAIFNAPFASQAGLAVRSNPTPVS
jgi:hypothetical protein